MGQPPAGEPVARAWPLARAYRATGRAGSPAALRRGGERFAGRRDRGAFATPGRDREQAGRAPEAVSGPAVRTRWQRLPAPGAAPDAPGLTIRAVTARPGSSIPATRPPPPHHPGLTEPEPRGVSREGRSAGAGRGGGCHGWDRMSRKNYLFQVDLKMVSRLPAHGCCARAPDDAPPNAPQQVAATIISGTSVDHFIGLRQ